MNIYSYIIDIHYLTEQVLFLKSVSHGSKLKPE